MLKDIRPDIPIIFLNTGFHFEETLRFAGEIADSWNLNVVEVRGTHGSTVAQEELYGPRLFENDPERCCLINKVEPLLQELEQFDAWITGIRRDQSATRSTARIFQVQVLPSKKAVTKIQPLVACTQEDIDDYVRLHDVPLNPLIGQGFGSIGCWPCTQPNGGKNDRTGRWPGLTKVECGLHDLPGTASESVPAKDVLLESSFHSASDT